MGIGKAIGDGKHNGPLDASGIEMSNQITGADALGSWRRSPAGGGTV
jgi:hypothetical protein